MITRLPSNSSASSGDGDEFFDAAQDVDEMNETYAQEVVAVKELSEENCDSENENGGNKRRSLDESNLEKEPQSDHTNDNAAGERRLEQEKSESWVSARSFQTDDSKDSADKSLPHDHSRNSIMDSVSESISVDDAESPDDDIEVSLERIRARIDAKKNSDDDDDLDKSSGVAALQNIDGKNNNYEATTKNVNSLNEDTIKISEQRKLLGDLDLSLPLSKITNYVDRPSTPTQNSSTSDGMISTPKSDVTKDNGKHHDDPEQFKTPKPENSFKSSVIDDCNVMELIQCDITSPLEALYLLCPQKFNLSPKEGKENDTDIAVEIGEYQRFSVSSEADPKGEAPLSPASEESGERHLDLDSSDDDSSTVASMGVGKFQIINKDTGEMHDMRDVMKEIDEDGASSAFDTHYTFLPSRKALEHQRSMSLDFSKDVLSDIVRPRLDTSSFDDSTKSQNDSPTASARKKNLLSSSMKQKASKMATNVFKGMSGLKSSHQQKRNRKRTVSGDMIPGNAIHVRSSKQYQKAATAPAAGDAPVGITTVSPFNPMLLIATIPHAHNGPAWCSTFSKDGRFLATGGEDGHVCVWAVAPKSKHMHPNRVETQEKEEAAGGSLSSDVSMEGSDDEEDDKVGETCPKKPSAPPRLATIGTGPEVATNMHIISSEPVQRFKDHTADVIDLSWSHSNFLLSASLDSSVRLYHFSKPGCLHLFKHASLVSSVAFDPNDDRYFISGGVDKKLRLWSIPDGRVKEWAQTPDVITSLRFTPDGKYAVAGLFRGQVYFYDVDGLKYYTQIACRNRSGKHRMGKKVTGISFMRGERDDWVQPNHKKQNSTQSYDDISESEKQNSFSRKLSDTGSRVANRVSVALRGNSRAEALRYTERMLVSTNDSRVRLYGLNDFCLVRKYKGHTNYSMQIRARVSESGMY